MKSKIQQSLNQDKETKILNFDAGDGQAIPMLLEIAQKHPAPLLVTIIDRRRTDKAEQLLLSAGFNQEGTTFKRDSVTFNMIANPNHLIQTIYSSGPFDLALALGDRLSAVAPQMLRYDVLIAITNVSNKMALSFKADDYHMEDLSFARSRGYERGEILTNGPDGLQTCGVYDVDQLKNVMKATGATNIEVFKQDEHPLLAILPGVGSCFKTRMLGVVAKGKAVRLADGVVNQIGR